MSTGTEAPASPVRSVTPRPVTGPSSALPPEEPPRGGSSLGTRIFLYVATLLACSLGLAVGFASRKAQRVAEAKIVADLKAVPTIYAGYVESQSAVRKGQVRSLAEAPGTKALLGESVDPETYHDSAAGFATGLGADTVFLFDARGALLTRTDRGPGEEAGRDFSSVSWVKTPIDRRSEAAAFILDVRGSRSVCLVASAPVIQGSGKERKLNGVLAAAFALNDDRAKELGGMTSGDVAVLGNVAPRDTTPSVQLLAATEALRDPGLPGHVPDPGAMATALFVKGEPFGPVDLEASGGVFIATAIPIRSGGGEPIAALLVARSKEAEMADFREIRRSLLVVGGLLLLASLPISFGLAQALSRPIRQLAHVAEEIGRGQLDVVLPRAGGEVGTLARAFSSMVSELKAKAQLEAMLAERQRRPGDVTFRGVAPAFDVLEEAEGLDVGRVFAGRYLVLSTLGEGGMGTVYRVRDRDLDDEVALKVLKPASNDAAAKTEPSSGPTAEFLRQEIKLARMITHLNVVRVHDFGEAEGVRYFSMEYVAGTTLRELLGQGQLLDLVPTLQIAKQVCRGLAAVHKAGIIHGDLKPQNVMVMPNGIVKLMDFGVARTRSAVSFEAPIAGTPAYMSPEQARGAALDEGSDLYSAGVLMFELFTGRCPFLGTDMYETIRMHLYEPPPDPRRLRADLPEGLAQIILTCLDKSSLRRPATAGDLERLLMRVHV